MANPEYINDDLYPYPWYKELVVSGAKKHQLPDDYVAYLELHHTKDDPNQHRVDLDMKIVRATLN